MQKFKPSKEGYFPVYCLEHSQKVLVKKWPTAAAEKMPQFVPKRANENTAAEFEEEEPGNIKMMDKYEQILKIEKFPLTTATRYRVCKELDQLMMRNPLIGAMKKQQLQTEWEMREKMGKERRAVFVKEHLWKSKQENISKTLHTAATEYETRHILWKRHQKKWKLLLPVNENVASKVDDTGEYLAKTQENYK